MGANAVVIEGIRVGEGAVVAAGAVVVEDVPATVVAGCPAQNEGSENIRGQDSFVDAPARCTEVAMPDGPKHRVYYQNFRVHTEN